jgi:hypothetical protein
MATSTEEASKAISFQYNKMQTTYNNKLLKDDDSECLDPEHAALGYNTVAKAVLAAKINIDMSWEDGLTILLTNRDKMKEEHKQQSYSGSLNFSSCEYMLFEHFISKREQFYKPKNNQPKNDRNSLL